LPRPFRPAAIERSPVNESDYPCLSDVRDGLKRHGMLDRFGIAFLHSHFDLQPGEVCLEETDDQNRMLVLAR